MTSSDLFGTLFVPDALREAVSDRAWIAAMLEFEAALATAEALAGVIPDEVAGAIAVACDAERFEPEALGRAARAPGNPAARLVRALTEAVAGDAARFVHRGATSQDVMDTASTLVARRVLALIADEMDAVAAACARLADEHRGTPMAGRTLLQQALPTTFGLKAAGRLVAVLDAQHRLAAVPLAVELGGAAGTLASLGGEGLRVLGLVAERLELEEPAVPWHTTRARVAELGAVLSLAAGALEKIAHDVTLLAQTEVAEVVDPAGDGRGGSSTLPHKRNPVGSVLAIACTRRVRGKASILLAAKAQEHERAAGAWQAEWQALTGALAHTGGAAAAVREVLEGLEVRPDRMRENLERTGGLVLAESGSVDLGERIGRSEAHELVEAASRRAATGRGPFREELLADEGDPLAPLTRRPRPRARRRRICGPGRGARRAGPEALPGAPVSESLHRRLEGPRDAPVLVLSNSLGTDLGMWDGVLPSLAGHFGVLRYDQRGHGRSPSPPGPYTIAELAADLLELLDRLGLERVSFCGTSMGAMTGMWLAARVPERLERLALCCTSAYLPPREMWTERAATVRAEGIGAVADAQLERWFTPALAELRPEAVERTRRTLLDTPAEGYAGCCEAIGSHDMRAELGSISTPTLVLAAADDPATPPEHGRLIAQAIDGARFVVLQPGRHLVAVERPDELTREVLAHMTAEAAA